ncbi:DUF3800 domain-containing protein [Anaerolineae bacterium CFX7]|nr:DUF3800 domain-containing protein [Anaerolineae bacterium CFX7]
MQYHFLDDSGDPGMSGAARSSSHFALAMVQFAENAPLPEIARVRKRFHFPPTFEFKFHSTKARHHIAFFDAIRNTPFRVRAVVIDKTRVEAKWKNLGGEELRVEWIVQLVMRVDELDLANDLLMIDGAPPLLCRQVRIGLSKAYKKNQRVRPFNKIVGGRSNSVDALQVADMIAGALRRYVVNGEKELYALFAKKVVDLWRIE